MDWRRKNWLIRNQCAIWMLIKLSATERYFSSSLSHTSRSFAISVFTFLFPEANICNNEKKSPHNFRSLCLCSLLNVDAAALPFFQYVNCSTKNKSPSIREKARSAVVIATDANAIYYIDSVEEIEKNEDGWKCADPLECHCRFNNLFTLESDCQRSTSLISFFSLAIYFAFMCAHIRCSTRRILCGAKCFPLLLIQLSRKWTHELLICIVCLSAISVSKSVDGYKLSVRAKWR